MAKKPDYRFSIKFSEKVQMESFLRRIIKECADTIHSLDDEVAKDIIQIKDICNLIIKLYNSIESCRFVPNDDDGNIFVRKFTINFRHQVSSNDDEIEFIFSGDSYCADIFSNFIDSIMKY